MAKVRTTLSWAAMRNGYDGATALQKPEIIVKSATDMNALRRPNVSAALPQVYAPIAWPMKTACVRSERSAGDPNTAVPS